MSKHTPGPWFQGIGDHAYCVYDKRVWVNPDGSRGGDTPNLVVVVSPDDAIADARLIAAAPDLLEALKSVVTWMDSPDESAFSDKQFAKCKKAITKATGGSDE